MMKKLLLACAVMLSASFAATAAIGDQFTKDGVRYEVFQEYTENGTLKVVAPGTNKKYTGALTVPYTFEHNGKEWYVVDMDWTAIDQEKITSLDLQYHPNDKKVPKNMGNTSFPTNSQLKSVKLSDGFKKIEEQAFYNCQKLESIEMPAVTELGENSFLDCFHLTTVNLNEGLTEIPGYCFCSCYSIKEIKIPASVVTIGTASFRYCKDLENVSFAADSKCEKIDFAAFEYCTSLKKMNMAHNISYIGADAFLNCSSLESVVIPYNYDYTLKPNKPEIFKGCANLRTIIDLNPSPQRVQTYLWSAGVEEPAGVSSMANCKLLVPNDKIRDYNYVEFNMYDYIKFTFEAVEAYTFTWEDYITYRVDTPTSCSLLKSYATEASEVTVTIPEKAQVFELGLDFDVTGICSNAFLNNKLPSITIPAGITWIGASAFEGCTNLSQVRFDCTDFWIGSKAFKGCTALESVKITGNCSIGSDAFRGCDALQNVRAVHLTESPGKYAFSDCPNLKAVYIGGEIKWLGDYLFERSNNLETIGIICDTPPEPYNAFVGIDEHYITLVVPPASIKEYVNHDSGKYYDFGRIESTTWLDDSEQFYFISEYNYSTEKIDASLYMIHTDENIGDEFTLPSSVTKFGETMSVVRVGNYACAGLKALKVTVPNSVRCIDECAFQYGNMKELWLPESMEYIYEKAFNGCSDLTDIYIAKTDPYNMDCADSAFNGVSRTNCTLHVPEDSLVAYRHCAPWNEFLNIEETGVKGIMTDDTDDAPWYNLQGIRVDRANLTPGLYIHNGKKVVVTNY